MPRLLIAAILGLAFTVAAAPTAGAAVKQSTCSAQKKKVKKTKNAKKKRAAKQALAQCQANLSVYKQIRGLRFVGTRGDGQSIDAVYCANGKWQSRVGNALSEGSGWRVVDATGKGKRFTAIVESPVPGGRHEKGVIRNGGSWQIGISFAGRVQSAGDVTASPAGELCA